MWPFLCHRKGLKKKKEANNTSKGVIVLRKIVPFYMIILVLSGIMAGCQRDIPNPESKPKIVPINQTSNVNLDIVPVYNQNSKEIPTLFVNHETKGNQVLVDCIVTGVSFRSTDYTKQRIGKIIVWIDGIRNTEVASAAFIIKGLSPGSHKIKLDVVKLTNEPYGLSKEFIVNIPK